MHTKAEKPTGPDAWWSGGADDHWEPSVQSREHSRQWLWALMFSSWLCWGSGWRKEVKPKGGDIAGHVAALRVNPSQ